MATTTETPKGAAQEAAQPSAKERYRNRYGEANPDLNLDDEEAFYGRANENLDELESLRESNRLLGEAFDRTPELAAMVIAAKEGNNPFAWLVENIGPNVDVRELADNPEFATQIGEAVAAFMENQKAAQAKKEEIGNNAVKSIGVLKELQAEMGLSDEQCIKMAKDFFGEFDEEGNPIGKDSFMQNAANGIVTKGMWESLVKGRNYDDDIASATDKAKATALNSKIQNGLKTFGAGVPSLSGGGKAVGEKKPAKKGGFADWGEDLK